MSGARGGNRNVRRSNATRPRPTRRPPPRRTPARRRPRSRGARLLPVVGLVAIVAFVVGLIVSTGGSSYTRTLASGFVAAWTKADYSAMYLDIDAASRHSTSEATFTALYREAAELATVLASTAGKAHELANGSIVVPVRVRTTTFGTLRSSFTIAFKGEGSTARIDWSRSLEFPGLSPGRLLKRRTYLPPRAALLTRTGSILASGEATAAGERSSPLGATASAIVGTVGPIPAEEARSMKAEGVPANAIVGVSGLERIFDAKLRGKPGGVLMAGNRVIAKAAVQNGTNVRTTISPTIQEAAVKALGGQYGGVVAMQPSTGQILGVAGIGLDDLQPPGSTFKMVTVTGVLQYHVATPQTVFPYASSTTLDGVDLHNSESESCGGSLVLAFAVSCNSVFAPLGVKLGAEHLVSTAERYGFNHSAGLAGAPESTIPHASEIQGELDLGSTAIGQGAVLASPLEMGVVAATIGDGGLRPTPTFALGRPRANTRVTSPAIAREVRSMMIAVVREGTGTSAAISGVTVAGKTGTAELGPPSGSSSSCSASSTSEASGGCKAGSNPDETDAWFASFAPAIAPRIAVAVLLVRDGFGGDTAAPVAKEVLEVGLR